MEWDPIGVRDIPGAEDEYDAYIPEIYSLLVNQSSEKEIFAYLWQLETEHMGLTGNETATRNFAKTLLNLVNR
jgi:hypothetical protein